MRANGYECQLPIYSYYGVVHYIELYMLYKIFNIRNITRTIHVICNNTNQVIFVITYCILKVFVFHNYLKTYF